LTIFAAMASTVLAVDPHHPDSALIARAAALLDAGELVAFPTETVYGLGADALNAHAVARIFTAKGRPAWNPLIAHVADTAGARALTATWPSSAQILADRFWPGPLTMVLPKRDVVPAVATAGLDAVGVRVPSHPVALALLRAFGRPIAAPSANRFTQVSPTTAAHVVASLGDRLSLVLDGGPCTVGIESTVIDLAGAMPTILRPGMITRAQLEDALQQPVQNALHKPIVLGDNGVIDGQRSPGMAERHYAPVADVWLFDVGHRDEMHRALSALTRADHDGPAVALLFGDTAEFVLPHTTVHRMPFTPDDYARTLYAALHAADEHHARVVVIERPPDNDAWTGVLDRLARSAR
jgi:L-threonylcarbamoyladenylate synthase